MTALPAPVFSGRSASSFLFLPLRQYGRDHRPAPYTGCNIPPVRSKLHIGSGGQRSAPHCKIQQRALHGDVSQPPLCILQRKAAACEGRHGPSDAHPHTLLALLQYFLTLQQCPQCRTHHSQQHTEQQSQPYPLVDPCFKAHKKPSPNSCCFSILGEGLIYV